jgi:transcriptional regulator with XRE-family HTH domain
LSVAEWLQGYASSQQHPLQLVPLPSGASNSISISRAMNEENTIVGLGLSSDSAPLYDRQKRTLGSALFRAMQVAGPSDDGYPSKLSQQALSDQSGVARSTISKYLDAKDNDDAPINPDLRTLCSIAWALNVSPAMLLLTPDDWSRLGQAAIDLRDEASNSQVQHVSTEMADPKTGPTAKAHRGLQLARLLGVYRDLPPPLELEPNEPAPRQEWRDAQDEVTRRHRLGIFVATSIPPLRDLPSTQHAALLTFCAKFGASTKN